MMELLTEQEVRDAILFQVWREELTCAEVLRGTLRMFSKVLITDEELLNVVSPQMLKDVHMEGITKQIIRMVRTQELENELNRLKAIEARCARCMNCLEDG